MICFFVLRIVIVCFNSVTLCFAISTYFSLRSYSFPMMTKRGAEDSIAFVAFDHSLQATVFTFL